MIRSIGMARTVCAVLLGSLGASTTFGQVLSHRKISSLEGGFTGVVDDLDEFGSSVISLGDLDGDGVRDLAVGARGDDDGGVSRGAVWILFLNADGTVRAHQKISSLEGELMGPVEDGDRFGIALTTLGDMDGDGVIDLCVGALDADDGGSLRGSIWILFLDTDGTVKAEQKISQTEGGFTGQLGNGNLFGSAVSALDDLDGDGVTDLAVGAYGDSSLEPFLGSMWILLLNADGTVKSNVKITRNVGGFTGGLDGSDDFGFAASAIGDVDGDGISDVAVGARGDDDGGSDRGALWILFLNPNGTVRAQQKISDTAGGFTGVLDDGDRMGDAVAAVGDLDVDGVPDVAVAARRDDDGGTNRGALWILYLNADGTVKAHQKISDTEGGFTGTLDDADGFGTSAALLEDWNGDGVLDLAVGVRGDDDGGSNRGALWLLSLDCLAVARASLRNAGGNALSYTANAPVLGGTFTGVVDLMTTGHAFALLVGYGAPLSTSLGGGQVLLVDVLHSGGELLGFAPTPGPTAQFNLSVPPDTAICGEPISSQALHIGGVVPFALSNARDLVVGP